MIRYLCDGCGKEIGRNYVAKRLKGYEHINGQPITVELILGVGHGNANSGHVCRACARRAVLGVFDDAVGSE